MTLIWYADGTLYDGPPEAAPGDGWLVCVQHDPDRGWIMTQRANWYVYWHGARWWGVDEAGMRYYLRQPGWRKVVEGALVDHALYDDIYQVAKAARDYAIARGHLPDLAVDDA